MSTQTASQIVAAWESAKQLLLPAVVSDLQVNADYIRHRMASLQLEWTPENIVAVVLALNAEGKILWDILPTAPKQKTQAEQAREFEKKERDRIRREAEENIAGQKRFNNLDLTSAASKEAKQQEQAQKSIDALIARYSVNGQTPGTIDNKKTEAGRAQLRAIKVYKSNGTYDAVDTLKVVGAAFHHDTVAEIRAAAQRELDRWKDENGRRRAEQTLQGAGPANLPRFS